MPLYEAVVQYPLLAGGVVASAASLTDITPLPQPSIPVNTLTVGDVYKVTAFGRYTCGATATNCLIGFYLGSTLVAGTLSTQALTTSQTNAPWHLEYMFVVRATGTSGSVWGHGWVDLGTSVSATGHVPIPSTANAAVTIDTTAAQALGIKATLSQVTGSPTITCDHMVVENRTTRS